MKNWWTGKPSNISPGIPTDRDLQAGWFKRRWLAVDQLVNVWVLNGIPDETISSNAGRQMRDWDDPPHWAKFVCWLCNYFQSDHCKQAIGAQGETPFHSTSTSEVKVAKL